MMDDHIELDRIHDLVDGALTAAEREGMEAHLSACPDCRATAEELAALRAELEALPAEARVPDAVWEGVRARIEGTLPGEGGEAARVLPFPVAGDVRRRLSLSLPQLAAAASVVALVSAGTVWMALRGPSSGVGPSGVATAETVGAARMVSSGEASYRAAAAELEEVLEQGRDLLGPETVAALERSLATIDEAIAEVEAALARDPASPLLARLLVSHQATRLRVLRQAAAQVPPTI